MRNQTIDFLRGVAVLLTLLRHAPFPKILEIPKQVGWVGVDLFFVLSGFLVSGLIFDEYEKTGKFNGKQFLIRRGFKIYPAFWVFIICTLLFDYLIGKQINWTYILGGLTFILNYIHNENHIWSLCVEEHFYFLVVILFLIAIKFTKNVNKVILVSAICIILYGITTKIVVFFLNKDFANTTHMFPTHLRIDSLMIGLLIAYLYRNAKNIIAFVVQFKILFWIITIIGLSVPFIWNIDTYPDQLYISGFGLISLSISFGLLMILLLENKEFELSFAQGWLKPILKIISFIGFYSYSIYLWHILYRNVMTWYICEYYGYLDGYIWDGIYVLMSVFVGVLLGKAIEIPFLKIRDKYFPKNYL